MATSREVRAAIGTVVIDTTWLENLAARLVVLAGLDGDERELLLGRAADLFALAYRAAKELKDSEVAERTRAWLREAEDLRRRRHEVVHSIVVYEHRPGWTAYHPKTGMALARRTRDVVAFAERVHEHAEEGTYMSLFDWPEALGLASPTPTEDEDD